jgi:hydrogenase nickel incorporation protein HypA/HybF
MHEMGIAEQLAQIAIDSIPKEIENPKVEKLNLKIGKLSSIVEHSLTFCFEIVSKGTPLEDARLDIESVPVKVQCASCKNEWEVTGPDFNCPHCKDGDVKMLTGREIEITSLELAE